MNLPHGQIPLAIQTWMAEQSKVAVNVSIAAELRTKTQEETGYSHYREYEETGLYDVDLIFSDNTTAHRTFTRNELEVK
jgi:hypothetical protein